MLIKLKPQKNIVLHVLALVVFSFFGAYVLQHFIFAAPLTTIDCSTNALCSAIPQCSQDGVDKNGNYKDQSTALNTFLDSLPTSNASDPLVVNFPSSNPSGTGPACYYTQSAVEIHDPGSSDITINGNGTELTRTIANDGETLNITNYDPYMAIFQNTNINVNGFTVNGVLNYNGYPPGYQDCNPAKGLTTACTQANCQPTTTIADCFNGGDLNEGHTGVFLEANFGVTLNNMTYNNIEGDCLSVMFPQTDLLPFSTKPTPNLNYDVNVTNSTFNGCGYDGVSVESACQATIEGNTFENMWENGTDFEVDGASTGWEPVKPYDPADFSLCASDLTKAAAVPSNCSGECTPWDYVQDDVTMANNTWENYGSDWFTSQQGQYPGIEEDDLRLSGNILEPGIRGGDPEGMNIDISGTPLTSTFPQYWLNGLTITGNTACHATKGNSQICIDAHPLTSVTPPGNPADDGYASVIQNAANLNFSGNTDPVQVSWVGSDPPYVGAVKAVGELSGPVVIYNNVTNVASPILEDNNFSGAYIPLDKSSSGNSGAFVQCGNTYWAAPNKIDTTCAEAPTPSVPTEVKASSASSTSVNLSWDASTDNGGPGLGGYNILRGGNKITSVGPAITTYTDNGLTPSTTYSYSIESYDKSSPVNTSAASASVNVTTQSTSTGTGPGPGVGGGSTGTPSNPIVVPKAVASTGGKATLCLPAGVNPNSVSSVTYSVGGNTIGSSTGGKCTTVNTSSLAPGSHSVIVTVHQKDGKTTTYKENLVVKSLPWYRRYEFWLILLIILLLLGIFDAIWWITHPNKRFSFSTLLNNIIHPKLPLFIERLIHGSGKPGGGGSGPTSSPPPTVIKPTE